MALHHFAFKLKYIKNIYPYTTVVVTMLDYIQGIYEIIKYITYYKTYNKWKYKENK